MNKTNKYLCVAVTLAGILSSTPTEAATKTFKATGWNGNHTIIGNMRGVTSGRHYNINPDEDLQVIGESFHTSKRAYGFILEKSSYHRLETGSHLTFNFGDIRSTNDLASGFHLKNNALDLYIDPYPKYAFEFSGVYGELLASGIALENSHLLFSHGSMYFDKIQSNRGMAQGIFAGTLLDITSVQFSTDYNTRQSARLVVGSIEGKHAYGVRFEYNGRGSQLLMGDHNNGAGGIFIDTIHAKGDSSSRAALFYSAGTTILKMNGSNISFSANSIKSSGAASVITVFDGSFSGIIGDGATLSVGSVSADYQAYGFQFEGYTDGMSKLNAINSGRIDVGSIGSNFSDAYGFFLDKATFSGSGFGGTIHFGEISTSSSTGGNAYGYYTKNQLEDAAIAWSDLRIDKIKARKNAYGFYAENNQDVGLNVTYGSNLVIGEIASTSSGNQYKAVGIDAGVALITFENSQDNSDASILFNNIHANGEANGARVKAGFVFNASGSSFKEEALIFGNIQSEGHNAIGIYDPDRGQFDFLGKGIVEFSNIQTNATNYTAAGIIVDRGITDLNIVDNSEVKFKRIFSRSYAFGAKTDSLYLNVDNGKLNYDSISGTNIAVGINASNSLKNTINGGGVIAIGNVSSHGSAYGFESGGAMTIAAEGIRGKNEKQLIIKNVESVNNNAIALYSRHTASLTIEENGSIFVDRVNGNNAYGLKSALSSDIFVNNNSSLDFSRLSSKNATVGIEADGLSATILDGSQVSFGNINANRYSSNGNAIAFYSHSDANLTLRGGSIHVENIDGKNAYGIKTCNITGITVEGGSNIRFDSISSSYGKSVGIEANFLNISSVGNGQLYFGDITSDSEANGLRVTNKITFDLARATISDRVVFQNIQSTNGNALGMYVYGDNSSIAISGSGSNIAFKNIVQRGGSSHTAAGIISDSRNFDLTLTNGNRLWFDNITSEGGKAIGLKTNSMMLALHNGSEIHFINMNGHSQTVGIWTNDNNTTTIQGGGKIFFENMSGSDIVGIHAWGATLNINNTEVIFGRKTTTERHAIHSNIANTRFALADTNINIEGSNSVGIYGEVDTKIDLRDGKTLKISARNGDRETMAIDGRVNLFLKGVNSTLMIDSGSGHLNTLGVATNSNVNLVGTSSRNSNSLQLRKLEIDAWNGSGANVLLYANGTASIDTRDFDGRAYQPSGDMAWCGGSDRIIINGTNASSRQDNTLKVALSTVDNPIKYVVLAEVKGDAKDKIIFNNLTSNKAYTTTVSEVGFDVTDIEITRHDDGNTAYYVGKIPDKNSFRLNQKKAGRVVGVQNASSTVVAANFNNLNKRMGELRENNHSHGVWARVFNGEVESKFGDGSASNYTTVQAGYDYNLSSDLDSNSYLGFALSYLNSKTDNSVEEVRSNGVEAGVYFAYVQDSGLYTDTIAKLAYMSNQNSSSAGYDLTDTNTTSFILSQEIGYQVEVVNGFFLTPQFETTYAFFSGSDMTASQNGVTQLKSTQDAANTWRNRLGLQAAYKLQDEDKKFRASFYAMGSYTYDYNTGGDYQLETSKISTIDNAIKSDGRFVLNVGSNIDIKDATRLYVDFEKSFGGKINTNYQINVGVRYNFGEKVSSAQVKDKKQD